MKIVTDVGVIGLAQLFEAARTGIYRVVSNLTATLLARSDIDLSYTSLASLQVNQLTEKYLIELGFGAKGFPDNTFETLLNSCARKDSQAQQTALLVKIMSKLYRRSHAKRIGTQTDIYHSQYLPLPRFSRSCAPLKMLTVYDIIPLLHPEYFEKDFIADFKSILQSFSSEKDYLFTISECTKKDVCDWFKIKPERVFVTPLAAAPDLYYPIQNDKELERVRRKFAIPEGRYFLSLATVEKRKNLQMSIDCFRAIIADPGMDDVYFVLVGTKGWKIDKLIEQIENDSLLQNRVIFTGFVDDKYLSALYSGAEAFLYPSLYEGFGLPPLEAMQCGLPVICSNTSALPEVVGGAGLLVNPYDKDEICDAMFTLLNDSQMRQTFRAKGVERAAKFSWSRCADATVAGYRQAWEQR
jgi:glycosyltransferase involved in cell wall biosynthesis